MKIYFVRHGETESNATGKSLGPNVPLTELGREQADLVGRRLKNIPIDLVVSSTYPRAQETAAIINKHLDKGEVLHSELLVERRNCSELFGLHRKSPEYLAIDDEVVKNWGKPGWHYSDEESFEDQKVRVEKALDYLKNLEAENVLVVTHGMFLKMLISRLVYGKDLSPEEAWRFNVLVPMSNTGITLCEYNGEKNDDNVTKVTEGWRVRTWNDVAHL